MPMTAKGKKIMAKMVDQYGAKKGPQVFHAMVNEGKLKGVDGKRKAKAKK
jgi:hypothetical protein